MLKSNVLCSVSLIVVGYFFAAPSTLPEWAAKDLVGGDPVPPCNHSTTSAGACTGSPICETNQYARPVNGTPFQDALGTINVDYCAGLSCTPNEDETVTNRTTWDDPNTPCTKTPVF